MGIRLTGGSGIDVLEDIKKINAAPMVMFLPMIPILSTGRNAWNQG
jgi:hypothetical protein